MPERTVSIVFNTRSAGGQAAGLRECIETELTQAGLRLQWFLPQRSALLDACCEAAVAGGELVIAVGGDGTVRSVAQAARAAGKPMAIVPTGTYNYVARHLGIPPEPADACRLVIDGNVRGVACGDLNGKLFFNHAAFGLYTRIIAARERHTALLGRSRVTAVLSGLATLFNRYPVLSLDMTLDGETRRGRASAVFFAANPLLLASIDTEFAQRCGDSVLGLVIMQRQKRRSVLMAAVRAVFGRLAHAPDFDLVTVHSARVDVERRRRRLRVSIDGEIIKCPLPLEIHYQADALQIFTPERS